MWQVVQTKPITSNPIDWVLEDQTRIIILSIEGYIDFYIDVALDLAQIAKGSAESQTWEGAEPTLLQHLLLVDRAKC